MYYDFLDVFYLFFSLKLKYFILDVFDNFYFYFLFFFSDFFFLDNFFFKDSRFFLKFFSFFNNYRFHFDKPIEIFFFNDSSSFFIFDFSTLKNKNLILKFDYLFVNKGTAFSYLLENDYFLFIVHLKA